MTRRCPSAGRSSSTPYGRGWTCEPADVLDHLLDRGGVIRQPVLGRVDFVHRTFQEYLAAKEAADEYLVSGLLDHANSDQWRETIVMAAGHGTPKFRSDLLNGLLDDADQEPARARKLRLLAAACVETAHIVDRTVTDRIDAALDTVLPPRSTRESRSLSTGGVHVLGKLPAGLDGLTEPEARACVRTAALINGPEALQRLARWSLDPRGRVQRELAEVWRFFDPEDYARRVLADAPLDRGRILIRRQEHVPHTRHLTNLTNGRLLLQSRCGGSRRA